MEINQVKNVKSANLSSDDDIAELKEAFDMYDLNKDGVISIRELGTVMRSFGHNLSESDILEMVKQVDIDNNGSICFEEFSIMMSTKVKSSNIEEAAKKAFEIFDVNKDGCVSLEELQQVMTNLGEEVSEPEAKEMISVADVDGDGLINLNDFQTLMKFK